MNTVTAANLNWNSGSICVCYLFCLSGLEVLAGLTAVQLSGVDDTEPIYHIYTQLFINHRLQFHTTMLESFSEKRESWALSPEVKLL